MTSPGIPPIGATDRPPDRPDGPASSPGTGTLTVNGERLSVRQGPTNQSIVAGGVLSPPSPFAQGSPQPEVDDGSEASGFSDLEEPSLRGRVQARHEAKDRLTPGNRWGRALGMLLGGGLIGAGGAALGGQVGALLAATAFSWTGPGAIVAGIVGGLIGLYAGKQTADWASASPQKQHLDQAIAVLQSRPGGLSAEQKGKLAAVEDDDWRTLLHVPSAKMFGGGQVGGKEFRQGIRKTIVSYVAAGASVDEAARLRKLLIDRHNGQPGATLELFRMLDARHLPVSPGMLMAAAASGDHELHRLAARIIAASAAHQVSGVNGLPGGNFKGWPPLHLILRKSDHVFSGRLTSAAQAVANNPRLGSLNDNAVVREKGGTKSEALLRAQAKEAIRNLDLMMARIVGGKEDHAIQYQVESVSQQLRDLLKETIADAAKARARPGVDRDALARAVVSRALMLLALKATPEPREPLPRTNLAYNRKLVEAALAGPAAFDQVFSRSGSSAVRKAEENVEAAVKAWHEPVRKFVDALVTGQMPEAQVSPADGNHERARNVRRGRARPAKPLPRVQVIRRGGIPVTPPSRARDNAQPPQDGPPPRRRDPERDPES